MGRSLGGGGGGGAGRGMVGTFQRAIKAGAGGAPPTNIGGAKIEKANKKQPTSPNTALTLFSPSFSSKAPAVSAPAWISSSSTDESEWEYVARIEDETAARVLYDDYVFGTVPSTDEVHHAVSALQQALVSCSDVSSPTENLAHCEIDWVEPSHIDLYSSKALQRPSTDVVNDAFHLLETEPSVQRMVVSLSSDQAVWDAVMNNQVVKELRGSIHRVRKSSKSSDPEGDENIMSWVVKFARAKIIQLTDLITKLVSNVFQGDKKGGDGQHGLDEKVKSSLFLSIMVLLVVILARTKTSND